MSAHFFQIICSDGGSVYLNLSHVSCVDFWEWKDPECNFNGRIRVGGISDEGLEYHYCGKEHETFYNEQKASLIRYMLQRGNS